MGDRIWLKEVSDAAPEHKGAVDTADFQLADLMDLAELNLLLDNFCHSVGIASAIIDLQGKVLIASRWQRICTDFHRVNKTTCARCIESDTDLALQLQAGQDFSVYKCKNGMTDAASPIIIEGQHLANVFVGQFLLASPNRESFARQAELVGFDRGAYLDALDEVPIIAEEKLPAILGFLSRFARLVASIGLQRLRAERLNEQLSSYQELLELLVKKRTSELALHNRILEQLSQGVPLSGILDTLARQVEAVHPGMRCSILLLDTDGKRLLHGAAPSLPDFYNQAVHGLEIGDGVGSCGTAAYRCERVIVEDIQQHPYWAPFRALARQADLQSCWSQPIKNSDGQVLGTFAIYQQKTAQPEDAEIILIERYANLAELAIERKKAEEQINNLAFYDPLTQLPNRRLLMDRLQHALASSSRNAGHGALLFIDIDNFKSLNDTRGHDVGDMLLVQVAQRVQDCVREGDTVARLGGDEFVVMLENLSGEAAQAAAQAELVGEKILGAINRPCSLLGHEYYSTTSIGLSLFRENEMSVDELLKRADSAMYQAKRAGRNTLRFFDPAMQAALEVRMALESDLREALQQQQFRLYYQMQVDHAGRVIGAEVLLRWIHPERGMVSPLQFIPLAEETGLILPIGRWVLETACAQIKTWESGMHTHNLQLAVNVSARQFRQADFVAQVQEVLEQSAIDPSLLKLELTESMVLDDVADTIVKMQMLKQIGVRFSMDDFGTGYSSLAYLTQLPLDQLKIDQSFVHNIDAKASDAVIVQTIIGMANNLGMEVIAEGVETQSQRDFLERVGCMFYQGYLFGKPVPLNEFEGSVNSRFRG